MPVTATASCPRHDEEIGVAAGLHHGAQFLLHFFRRYQLLAREVPAFLRLNLILQMQHRGARFFPQGDGALCIERPAIAGVGIGENRDLRDPADAPDVFEHLGLGEHAEIRLPRDDRGSRKTADIDRRSADLFGELCRDRIMGTHADKGRCFQQFPKAREAIHMYLPWISSLESFPG